MNPLTTGRLAPLTLAILLWLPRGAQGQLAPRTDNQLRPEVSLTLPISQAVDFNLSGQVQLGQHAARVVQKRVGIGLQLKTSDLLTLALGYQHLNGRPITGPSVRENRPTASATLRLSLPGGITLSDRNMVERRFRGSTRSTRYRNRITLERGIGSGTSRARAFLSDEVYFDSRFNRFVRNQLAVGVARPLSGGATAELYLMRQNDGRARPGDMFILGTVLRLRR